MKFATDTDVKMFLLEIEDIDAALTATKDFTPTKEMIELFVKKRKNLITGLKDFRRKQNTKQQWRHERYKMLRGIKRFHKSTAGKKFHRALGRYIATRESMENSSEDTFYLSEVSDVLKALSSLKTHAFIELEYFHPLSEELEYRLLFEELIPLVNGIERNLLRGDFSLDERSEEVLLRITDFDQVINHLAIENGLEVGIVDELYAKIKTTDEILEMSGEEDGYYCNLFASLKGKVRDFKSE